MKEEEGSLDSMSEVTGIRCSARNTILLGKGQCGGWGRVKFHCPRSVSNRGHPPASIGHAKPAPTPPPPRSRRLSSTRRLNKARCDSSSVWSFSNIKEIGLVSKTETLTVTGIGKIAPVTDCVVGESVGGGGLSIKDEAVKTTECKKKVLERTHSYR